MSDRHGPSPRAKSAILYAVVALWVMSVAGQMLSSAFGFNWTAPTGLNELGTAVVMAMLAANRKTLGLTDDAPEQRATQPDPPAPRRQPNSQEADDERVD